MAWRSCGWTSRCFVLSRPRCVPNSSGRRSDTGEEPCPPSAVGRTFLMRGYCTSRLTGITSSGGRLLWSLVLMPSCSASSATVTYPANGCRYRRRSGARPPPRCPMPEHSVEPSPGGAEEAPSPQEPPHTACGRHSRRWLGTTQARAAVGQPSPGGHGARPHPHRSTGSHPSPVLPAGRRRAHRAGRADLRREASHRQAGVDNESSFGDIDRATCRAARG